MEQTTALRVCRKCTTEKPISEYYRDSRSPGGFRTACRTCHIAAGRERQQGDSYRAYQAAYRAAHRERARQTTARYRQEKPGRVRAAQEAYRADPEHQRIARDRATAFRLANPERRSEYARRRYALKRRGQLVGFIDPEALAAKLQLWDYRCWMCRTAAFQAWDHVKPLTKGGLHVLSNLRPACNPCNQAKSDRWPYSTSVHR